MYQAPPLSGIQNEWWYLIHNHANPLSLEELQGYVGSYVIAAKIYVYSRYRTSKRSNGTFFARCRPLVR